MRGAVALTMRRHAAVALGAAAVLAGPVAAKEFGVASQDEIVAGARSCVASVGPAGLDEAHRVAAGWSKGAMTSKDGKPVASDLIVYGKGNLMMLSTRAAGLCTVTARIASVRAFPGIQSAMASAYGAPFKDDGKGEQFFQAPDHRFIDLASTGSKDRPAVRVAVGYVSQESK